MKVGENHPRIRIIKNYVGKCCDNYAISIKLTVSNGKLQFQVVI